MANDENAAPAKGGRLDDFPEFFGAMIVKELRQGVRGKMFVVPFVAIHVAMLIALGFDLTATSATPAIGSAGFFFWAIFSGMPGQAAFWQVAFLLMLVVMPWAGLSALKGEREGRNGELLLLAGVSRWKIVLGKWLTLCALGTLTSITMFPYLLVRYFIGGMNVPATLSLVAIALCFNATANAMAIGLSGYESVGVRFFVGVAGAFAFLISTMIVTRSAAFLAEMVFGNSELAAWTGVVFGVGLTGALYCAMGLQLARLRMRPYERPYEEVTSGGLCSFIILCPILLGIVAVLTFGTAAGVGAILLMVTVIRMDPTPKERRKPKLYPPSRAPAGELS